MTERFTMYDARKKLIEQQKEIDLLRDRNEVLEKSAEINSRIMDSYGPRFDKYDEEIERLQKANTDLMDEIRDAEETGFIENYKLVREIERLRAALERIVNVTDKDDWAGQYAREELRNENS